MFATKDGCYQLIAVAAILRSERGTEASFIRIGILIFHADKAGIHDYTRGKLVFLTLVISKGRHGGKQPGIGNRYANLFWHVFLDIQHRRGDPVKIFVVYTIAAVQQERVSASFQKLCVQRNLGVTAFQRKGNRQFSLCGRVKGQCCHVIFHRYRLRDKPGGGAG